MTVSRRSILRGLGAGVSLPWLPSIAGAVTESTPRFITMFLPCGVVLEDWVPASQGTLWSAPFCLQPLAPVRQHVRVISGLARPGYRDGSHGEATKSALATYEGNGDGLSESADSSGQTVDQAIADVVGGATAFSSLVLGSEVGEGCPPPDCGSWLFHTSWRDAATPVAGDRSTRSVFERLFGAPGAAVPTAERLASRRSVLDAVLQDIQALERALPSAETARLDGYLTGVRALEKRLQPSDACGGDPVGDTDDFTAHVDLMLELTVQALVCDRTRVVSYMPGVGRSHRRYGFLGASYDHHVSSHADRGDHSRITQWYVDKYTKLLQRLAAEPAPEGGTLLDHTYVLMFSGMGDGDEHSPRDLPILLGGGQGIRSFTSTHLRHDNVSVSKLHLALLRAYDPTAQRFGRLGTTPLLDLG